MARADGTERLLLEMGERIRQLRLTRGWTRLELADRSQLSPRFLAQLESGQGNISILRLAQVAAALRVPLSDLFPEASPPRKKRVRLAAEAHRVIALIGLRGAGKSSVGALLSQRTGIPFVELDAVIEQAASMPLAQIFSIHGESYYRRLEYQSLRRVLAEQRPMILATGGSIVTDLRTWNLVRRHCTTVWLKALPAVYWNRLLKQGDTRPMKNNPSAMTELKTLLAAREPLYAQADHRVDTSKLSLEKTAMVVLRVLNSSFQNIKLTAESLRSQSRAGD